MVSTYDYIITWESGINTEITTTYNDTETLIEQFNKIRPNDVISHFFLKKKHIQVLTNESFKDFRPEIIFASSHKANKKLVGTWFLDDNNQPAINYDIYVGNVVYMRGKDFKAAMKHYNEL